MTASQTETSQTARLALFVLALVVIAMALWLVRDILMLMLTAVIFAILLSSPVRFFVRRRVPRPLALGLTLFLIAGAIYIGSAMILPSLIEQFGILSVNTIPRAWELLQAEIQPEVLIVRYPFLKGFIEQNDLPNQILQQIVGALGALSGQVFPILTSLVGVIFSVLVIIFLSVYFVSDPQTHWRGILRLVPLMYRSRAREIMIILEFTLRRFLQAQIVLMLVTGVATTLGLSLIGLPLSGALGVITGLFSFVPNFGPIAAVVVVMAVAVINAPTQLGLILLIYFVIQFVVSQIVTPLFLGQEMSLPPAAILISQLMAGIFFGFLGLLLCVPLAAITVVLVREVYVRDVLGDAEVSARRSPESERLLADASAVRRATP
jgi:predicted PurR-regulated permease PerM